jgi:hypothetical protein
MVELYLHSSIYLHDVVFNKLAPGINLALDGGFGVNPMPLSKLFNGMSAEELLHDFEQWCVSYFV